MKLIIFVIIAVVMMATSALCDAEYEIVDTKNVSTAALTKSLLSEVIRIKYKIIVSSNLSKKEYEQLFNEILDDIRAKNNDIDVIIGSVYDKENLGIANFSWYPVGGWAYVDSYIASSNNRKDYEFHINWSNNYLTKNDGLLKTIHKAEDSYVQTEQLGQNVPLIAFDIDTGILKIEEYKSKDAYPELSKYEVYDSATAWLLEFPLKFKEIKRYQYILIWGNVLIIKLDTDREELDSIPLKKITNRFNQAFERQQKKFDRQFIREHKNPYFSKTLEEYEQDYLRETEQEDKLSLEMYHYEIFKYFKNKHVNI